ncbi:response regulator transcription factor [Mucilaginibacter myungsuensis]|uniref:Response regulator transcription factor n=1 Tax=Mucilaginibacter myungsuensis TaxID=649104 RepID=A0A929KU35_9SPHI|nr:response regulator transcription factor [Mucilaginibacter myungsuensis]MBE9660418.1 response regulator transcription factor [Mucilaginibacter myungsuensis]MDN3600460.1 response regulator transcription factor [Mucilaginibacter myungsuensis]
MINRTTILIADDHQMVIDGLQSMLAQDEQYQIVGQANNGQIAYEMLAAEPEKYQLLLTDISMPLLTGTQLCKMVKSQFPHVQVLILSMYNNAPAVKEAVMAEADGYILKNAGRTELLQALHRITNGGTYFSQDIVPIIYNQYNKQKIQDEQLAQLSAREKEVLGLIVKECTSEEIAEKLFISKKTVDNHRQHLLEKTNCKSTVGLVKFAIKSGLE